MYFIVFSLAVSFMNPSFFRDLRAGYIVPGLGLQPLRFSSSSEICWPLSSSFDSKNNIRNERKPRMSQHDFFMLNYIELRIKSLLFSNISDNRYI